jgi:hypothetical protein
MKDEKLKKETEPAIAANRLLPAVFKEAIEVANGIEEQVRIVMPDGTDYDVILRLARYAADRMRSVIPIHAGCLNTKWKLYDTVFIILNGRLNGR